MAFAILHFGHLNEDGRSSNLVPGVMFNPSSMLDSSNMYPQILHLYLLIIALPFILESVWYFQVVW